MKAIAKNPILPGFNPDPSIVRVGEDYYLATSTFEWFPGVQIYHSKDLASWELFARPLNRISQLELKGVADSSGVWAPCLSYCDGVFYLAYTIVRNTKSIWRDMRNYLVTATAIDGDWSEPIFLNGTGHDPSLFHDDDGRKWLVNSQWEYFGGRNEFSGIVLQEYDAGQKKLIGPIRKIFTGTKRAWTEAPHLYKVDGYYFLLTAEGGTWYGHCATIARSRTINGPYEISGDGLLLTSYGHPELVLQKTGHADLVETDDGWFMVHLCARPLTPHGRCVLGRETAIQQVVWEDGWPRLATQLPEERVTTLVQSDVYDDRGCHRDHFDQPQIGIHYQTLRVPMCASIFDLEKHESHLRIYGGEAFSSLHEQSLLARRVQAFSYRIETSLEFSPDSSRDMAGLVLYYNTENYVYLCVTRNRSDKECIQVFQCNRNELHAPLEDGIMILKASKVHLRMDVQRERGACFYSLDGEQWESVVADFPADYLSDDYIAGRAFTGTFAGICCQALGAERIFADFDYFDYEETEAE